VIAAAGGWLKANHIRQLQDIKGKVRDDTSPPAVIRTPHPSAK